MFAFSLPTFVTLGKKGIKSAAFLKIGFLEQLNAKVIAASPGENYRFRSESQLHAIYDRLYDELTAGDVACIGRAAEYLLGRDGAEILARTQGMTYVPTSDN